MIASFPELTAAEAAAMIHHGETVGFSGFTPAGAPNAIPLALADCANSEHKAGREFQIGVLTGASTGPSLDGALAKASAISFRTPYQTNDDLRDRINQGKTAFCDMHLSLMPQVTRYGFLGHVDWAVVEACDITAGGGIVLTSAVGTAPTFCNQADKILIELNRRNPPTLLGIHDIYEPADPPNRRQIPIYSPSDRIGSPIIAVSPSKIVGVVETNLADEARGFSAVSAINRQIGTNVAEFLAGQLAGGHLPQGFLPIQSGVGDIANSILAALGSHPDIPPFQMYTEVIQDAVIELLEKERVTFASSCSLTVTNQVLQKVYDNLDWFRSRIVLRPQEISNNPEVIRRLGIISINTAIEVDIFGNVNSTHVMGRKLMNGIGGSGDFTRNAYLSTFTCPSTAKGGKITTIVPLVSHVDHSEHSVQIIATEQGVADLRGKSPYQRAIEIINKCAHPEFRELLMSYLTIVEGGYTPHTLSAAFRLHEQFQQTGDMRGVTWGDKVLV
ncbi:MAG TPA: acetyl-CoA hydrolase/transferase family protein [Candidatus Sulfopaludibacter sp.]|jgi:acetyl-CoA hydrolase|nr:acetyl-CoA hydrolase/transferase family protein [Candidatus Sulfopaludibacter sp.]